MGGTTGGTPSGGATSAGGGSDVGGSSGLGGEAQGGATQGGAAQGGTAGEGSGGMTPNGGDSFAGDGGEPASGGADGSGGTLGEGGTGGDPPPPDGCDWTAPSCADESCEEACPTNDGGDCVNRCGPLVACLQEHPNCGTDADPMCVKRDEGASNVCTTEWETAGGGMQTPSELAVAFFECACGIEVP